MSGTMLEKGELLERLTLAGLVCPMAPMSVDIITWDDSGICTPQALVASDTLEFGFVLTLPQRDYPDVNHVTRLINSLDDTTSPSTLVALICWLETKMRAFNIEPTGCTDDSMKLMAAVRNSRLSGDHGWTRASDIAQCTARLILEYICNPAVIFGWYRKVRDYVAGDMKMTYVPADRLPDVRNVIVSRIKQWDYCEKNNYELAREIANICVLPFITISVASNLADGRPAAYAPRRLGSVDSWHKALHDTTVPCYYHVAGTNGYSLNWFVEQLRTWLPIDEIVNKMVDEGLEWTL